MARREKRARVVLTVTYDEADGLPVQIGTDAGLVLATFLAGAEVEVTDIGPALGQGDRERGSFKSELEYRIGALMHRLGREPWMSGSGAIGAPRRGTDARDRHFEEIGRLHGLMTAYDALTGLPRGAAAHVGQEAWAARHEPAAEAAGEAPRVPGITPSVREEV